METEKKITVVGVLSEGTTIGIKNAASLLVASLLWIITSWIPYLNVGTTIAMSTIPIELSKGKIVSPTFIFEAKYRRYMGEYFTLKGLMWMSIIPASLFFIVPGIIISIGWSLALFILLDKGISPGESMIRSNNATKGYKWTIFGVGLVINVIAFIIALIFSVITDSFGLQFILFLILMIAYVVAKLGCNAVIYKKLVD